MKYKADYSKKYTISEAALMHGIKFIIRDDGYVHEHDSINYEADVNYIFYFNEFGHLFNIKGEDKTLYIWKEYLINAHFYIVKEIDLFNDKKSTKEPLDANRKISKGTITDIKKEMVIDGLNVTEHIKEICKEEIAKSERQINAKKSIVAALNTASYVINHCHNINNNMNKKKKKTKQEFDGDKKIYIHKVSGQLISSDSIHNINCDILGYRLATQSDINKFFKGTKNRYKYYKENKLCPRTHAVISTHFYKTKDINQSPLIEVTEAEYLEGVKK